MSTTNPNRTSAATAADGSVPPPGEQPLSPTVTHYQQLASEFMAALDDIANIIPKLEAAHVSTANFVRSHLNVPMEFLATATASVEQTAELQAVKKLDVTSARDTLQFIDAFRPVLDKVIVFAKNLQFTLNSRKASLSSEALQIYVIAKGLARDPKSASVASLVANMKRDLGRRGPKTSVAALRKATTSPGIGVPAPQDRDGSEPRG